MARLATVDTIASERPLTYEELQNLAKKNYAKGGDVVVECWGKSEFDSYVEECGPITYRNALELFELYHGYRCELG